MYSVTASGNTVNYRVHTSLRRPSVSLGSGTSLMDRMKVETRSAVGSDSQPHLGELEIVYYLKNKKKKKKLPRLLTTERQYKAPLCMDYNSVTYYRYSVILPDWPYYSPDRKMTAIIKRPMIVETQMTTFLIGYGMRSVDLF